jgi:arylsulfatase A-like enzyme
MTRNQQSIILVTVDCLRADHVGFMGYKRPTTPFLDSLANEAFVVPNAIAAGAPTYYSFPAILASRYPLALGRDVLGLAPDESTLASVLKRSGYATAAFSADNPYLSSRFGYDLGFDVFRDFLGSEPAPIGEEKVAPARGGLASGINRKIQELRPTLGPLGSLYDELYFRYCQQVTPVPASIDELRRFPSADVIVDEASAWLGSIGNAPFFLWLHLMDPHAPYYPKQEALADMGESPLTPEQARYVNSFWGRMDLGASRLAGARDEVVSLYDAGVRWVDRQMARFVELLKHSSRWDDCIFALTADHGEEFLDHGGRYHPPAGLAEELVHVPLLLRVPHARNSVVSRAPFSLLHLAPTLLQAAAIPIPPEFSGASHWQQLLAGSEFNSFAISECVAGCTNPFRAENRLGSRVLSIRDARFKLVLFFATGSELLYDLDADPSEQCPLSLDVQKPVRRQLLEVAHEHLREVGNGDLRLRLQARLRDLRLEWGNLAQKSLRVAS